jgi:hypothetical protein
MNQKDILKWGLLALGAYLVYKYIQENGGVSGLFGTTAAGAPPLGTTPTTIAPTVTHPATTPSTPPVPPPATPANTQPVVGQIMYGANNTQWRWTGSNWQQIQPAPPAPVTCGPGLVNQNGVCVPAPPVSQQMVALAGKSDGLSLDQWCYYYTQATGLDCPFDPGNITPQAFNDAGVQLIDGTIGDRSTPTSVSTWLAFAQLNAPQLSLTGLGAMPRFTPSWLM